MTGDAASVISFSREPLSIKLIEELQPILEAHYKEIAEYQDIPLRPAFDSYWDAEKQGRLRIYIVRKHGEVIGYNVVVMQLNAHYSTSKQAVQDILYVMAEHRMEGIGRRLVVYCNEQLGHEGVQVLSHHVKAKHPALGHILETEGFELKEYIYQIRLDKPQVYIPTHRNGFEVNEWE